MIFLNGLYFFAQILRLILLSVKIIFFFPLLLYCLLYMYYLMGGFFRLENHQAQSVWRIPCSVVTLLRITFISCHVLVQQKSPPRRQTPDLSLSKHCIIKTSVNLHDQNSLNQVENLVMCNFWTLMEQCFTFQKMLRPGILPEKKQYMSLPHLQIKFFFIQYLMNLKNILETAQEIIDCVKKKNNIQK